MNFKRFICIIICTTALICNSFAIDLYIDRKKLDSDVSPVIANGRTLVPMRAISEAMNAKVVWNDDTSTAVVTQGNTTLSIALNSDTAYINDTPYTLDTPAQLINGRTMVPARFIAESFDAKVDWDAQTQTILISAQTKGILTVYYLDVGQADSMLLIYENEAMLIDAGTNAAGKKVNAYLKNKGVNHLKYAVATHPHADHIGGLDDVLNQYPVDEVLMPNVVNNTKSFSDVLDAIETNHVKLTAPKTGNTYTFGDANIVVMNVLKTSHLNNSSLVMKVTHGNNRFLFTGDTEIESEAAMLLTGADLRSDVLKVGHHGSSTSTSLAFLNAVSPKDAVISCGLNNKYGHPNQEILDRLRNVKIWRTDINGTITLTSNGNSYSITAEK